MKYTTEPEHERRVNCVNLLQRQGPAVVYAGHCHAVTFDGDTAVIINM